MTRPSPRLRARLFLVAAALALSACAAQRPPQDYGTLIALRHADRTWSMLNETGVARAQELPAALADEPIDAIYVTPRQRNIDTATPLAEARGLPVNTLPANLAAQTLFADGRSGKTVVWVGNQENLGFLWAELGIPGKPPVQFGDIAVVTLPADGGPAIVEKRHYGP